MRALKLAFWGALSVALLRYIPVYYHTSEFNRYVREQVPRIRQKAPIKEAILSKAGEYNLDVTAQNITMSTSDSVLRVNVEYSVPVNFYLFQQDLTFRAAGSGFMRNN